MAVVLAASIVSDALVDIQAETFQDKEVSISAPTAGGGEEPPIACVWDGKRISDAHIRACRH